ncbi:ribosome biogenesis protein [Colletotrichum plurivorum]|uniref:Ribosome biogenesis protein n=1 Tax=Colletotrichum plurivorum TaxID=2175906 RepID=A0A8H6U5J2_9PEZI|nr:ribosome biogenesis protein [Colletotrichum plurivorum]
MAPKASAEGLKRKRASSTNEKSKKRAKSESESEHESSGDENDLQEEILLMEKNILESKEHYNDITKLIKIAKSFEDEADSATLACVALCRVFVRLISAGALNVKKGVSEKKLLVCQWLKDRFSEYKSVLIDLIGHEDLATTALTLAMRCLKAQALQQTDKEEYIFPQNFLADILTGLLKSDSDDARVEFVEKYLSEYDDIRFCTLKAIKTVADAPGDFPKDELFDDAFELLSNIGSVPTALEKYYVEKPKKKSHNLNNLTQHKRQGQDAWLAVLKLASTKEQRKRVLDIMSNEIAPWFVRPELLADFLTDSYDAGGSSSLLALSGVFYLIKERNLDYPSFYTKLYSLLDREILHSKHRSRFFRLMDTFLASTHLPAVLVASFIKKLARLSLNAPPSAIVFIVPWFYNIFRRHPLCTFMLHREVRDEELKALLETQGLDDPFLEDEADPMETRAIDSCLWEIVQLQSHYHPNVATIAKIISEQFTKQSYNIEDFLDHSYGSLLEAEMGKNVKKPPVIEFQIPKRVFLPNDPESGVQDNLLTKLWDF